MHSNCTAPNLAGLRGSCSHAYYSMPTVDVSGFLYSVYEMAEAAYNSLNLDHVFIPVDVFVSNVKTFPLILHEAFCWKKYVWFVFSALY